MPKRIGGQNLEGRYFIISVPDDWTENDPLPAPSPDDRWFDRMSDFRASLDCPWIRVPLRHSPWKDGARPARPLPANNPAPARSAPPFKPRTAAGE
jgi:hypothetical protein